MFYFVKIVMIQQFFTNLELGILHASRNLIANTHPSLINIIVHPILAHNKQTAVLLVRQFKKMEMLDHYMIRIHSSTHT